MQSVTTIRDKRYNFNYEVQVNSSPQVEFLEVNDMYLLRSYIDVQHEDTIEILHLPLILDLTVLTHTEASFTKEDLALLSTEVDDERNLKKNLPLSYLSRNIVKIDVVCVLDEYGDCIEKYIDRSYLIEEVESSATFGESFSVHLDLSQYEEDQQAAQQLIFQYAKDLSNFVSIKLNVDIEE